MVIKNPLEIIQQPEVGKLILKLRTIAGLTQQEFATSLSVTYSTVNRWENGHSKPSRLAMHRIKEMLEEIGEQGQELLATGLTQLAQAMARLRRAERLKTKPLT